MKPLLLDFIWLKACQAVNVPEGEQTAVLEWSISENAKFSFYLPIVIYFGNRYISSVAIFQ
ncbi:hypothetical protein Bsel_1682 [[Bacillus] selenitireducens MLS10]|uniref:Uncharacterized protein n=1 Tax=Bacillus selenitireducens (strain ATCC 700615 / DSM 15326 / MLS10) TaxID=439292 RepID=D6XTQ4_BACIE|nr:hypothetical protein Bsel_1682 [[Bacillus] selenitireducens MLS10]